MLFTKLWWFDYSSSWSSCIDRSFSKFSGILSKFTHFPRFNYWLAFGSISMSLAISMSFSVLTNFESTLMRWDVLYFFVLHCPCRLKMFKIKAWRCCLELFQFMCSYYSSNRGPCGLNSKVEVLWIDWLFVSRVLF